MTDDDLKIEDLAEANQQLRDGLRACRELVVDYRSRLAANGNEPLSANESELDSDAARS